MKLQLNESTLNAYINEAIRQELTENSMDELFGSRVRKQSKRMITGQGWGNQRRSQDNLWGTANTDISSTDADEEVPQTLVGMIRKMENGLCAMEELSGIGPQEAPGTLANGVAQYRNGGGFKMKASLLAAINALSRIADRVSAVERASGSNAIMESAGDYMDAAVAGNAAIGMGRAAGEKTTAAQNLATRQAAYNKALNRFDAKPTNLNLNRGIGKEKAFIAAQTAAKTEQQAIYKAAQEYSKILQSSGKQLSKGGQAIGNTPEAIIKHYTNPNGAFDYKRFTSSIERNVPAQLKNNQELKNAVAGLNKVKPTGGFWAGQINNVKTGAQTVKKGAQTIRGAGEYGRYASTLAKGAGKGAGAARAAGAAKTTGQVLKGAGQIAKGVGQIAQIPMLLLSIADEAARQGAQARQRKIVRTYNCASVLAKRMANIAQEIAGASGEPTAEEPLMEINVRRSRKSFDSIEQGMNQLSALMKQINASVNAARSGSSAGSSGSGMPASLNTPEEIKQFQEWANANGYVDQNGQPLAPDGKFGPKTEYVYDQIAGRLGTVSESRKLRRIIKEGQDILSALTDLENKVGITGSGGRAYSDISRMSGGANGSRMQGARAAKFIIRTYPPVLNQYLQVLSLAGANVRGITPLRVDTRPNRDYDAREVEAINERIQQLLSIAQTVEINEPGSEEITLPPKPARRPNPNPRPQPEPEVPQTPDLGDVQIEEPEIEAPDTEIDLGNDELNIDKIGYSNPRGGGQGLRQYEVVDSYIENMRNIASMDDATKAARRRDVETYYQNGKALLNQAAQNGAMTYDEANERLKLLYNYYRQCKQTIRRTPTAQQQQPQQQLAESRTRKKLNEREFKKLVKQIVLESLTR